MAEISGYQVLENIYEGDSCALYRARREADWSPAILKVLKQDRLGEEGQAERFQEEYLLTLKQRPAGVREVCLLNHGVQGWALVMDEYAWRPLEQVYAELVACGWKWAAWGKSSV